MKPFFTEQHNMSKTRKSTTSTRAQREPRKGQPSKTAAKPEVASGKLGAIVSLLKRPRGASIAELCKATSWQAHSVRGALSGAIKKKMALPLVSEKTDGLGRYRISG